MTRISWFFLGGCKAGTILVLQDYVYPNRITTI